MIPNLLVNSICEALVDSQALKVYVCNVMTQPGETDQMSAADHIEAIFKHTGGQKIFEYALVNNQRLTAAQARKYSSENAFAIKADVNQIKKLGVTPITAQLLERNVLVRHDAQALARALMVWF